MVCRDNICARHLIQHLSWIVVVVMEGARISHPQLVGLKLIQEHLPPVRHCIAYHGNIAGLWTRLPPPPCPLPAESAWIRAMIPPSDVSARMLSAISSIST